jgi:parvulin-like peptidyl-prolyl isomerase
MHITVTDQDVRDAIFENPPADIRRQFTDSMGVFHAEDYVKALRDPKNDSLVRLMEAGVRDQLRILKWQMSMASYIQVTDDEMKDRFTNENAKATIDVLKVMPGQAELQQAASQVTDQDIQKYYDAHKAEFKQPEQRKFKFVPFPIMPSPRDSAKALEDAATVKRRLEAAPADQVDTTAKELLSDYAPDVDQSKFGGAQPIDPTDAMAGPLATAKVGDVVIATLGGKLSVGRVTSVADTGAPVVHARHIQIRAASPDQRDSAMKIAEDVYNQIKAGASFEEMAHNKSGDYRSAGKGGEIGWVPIGQFPPELRSAVEAAAPNTLLQPIWAGTGADIIQVLGKARRSLAGVLIPLEIKPSSQTSNMLQQQASAFRERAEKSGFDDAAKAASYRVIADAPPASKKGAPIFSSPAFVNWVFDAKKGEISSPFKLTQVHAIVVAQVTDILEAGPAPIEQVKDRIKQTVVQRKAVDLVMAKAQKVRAAIGNSGNLAAGAALLGDTSAKPLTLTLGPAESVNGLPSGEYVVNNAAFSMKPGEVSNVLKGLEGCYIVKLDDVKPATDEAMKAQRQTLLASLLQEKRQRFFMNWLDNRKASAVIVDYRQHH